MRVNNGGANIEIVSAAEDAGDAGLRDTSDQSAAGCCTVSGKLQEGAAHEPEQTRGSSTLVRFHFHIGDMSCPSCALKIEKALSGHPGVLNAMWTLAAVKPMSILTRQRLARMN